MYQPPSAPLLLDCQIEAAVESSEIIQPATRMNKIVLSLALMATIGLVLVVVLSVTYEGPSQPSEARESSEAGSIFTDTPVGLDLKIEGKAVIPDLKLLPFCSGACKDPRKLYGDGNPMNFPAVSNPIPRSTPDGANPWPVSDGCGGHFYQVTQRATWWDGFAAQKALPTSTWWVPYFNNPPYSVNAQGLTWPVYALPYSTMAAQNGFKMGYPTPQKMDGKPGAWDGSVPPMVQMGLISQMFTFGTTDGFINDKRIAAYDRDGLGVTLLYTPVAGGSMTIPVFRGSPFITVVYSNTVPMIDYEQGDIRFVNGVDMQNKPSATVSPRLVSGGVYAFDIEITMNGQVMYKWRMYTSVNIPIIVTKPHVAGCGLIPYRLTFMQRCTGQCVVRMALYYDTYQDPMLPVSFYSSGFKVNPALLDQSANVYPVVSTTSTRSVGFAYINANTLRTTFRWTTACMAPAFNSCRAANLLMLSLPHHKELFPLDQQSKCLSQISYSSMKGFATGVRGSSWTMLYNISSVIGNALGSNPFRFNTKITNTGRKNVIIDRLRIDMNFWTSSESHPLWTNGDCYYDGKLMSMISRLVLIADELGQPEIAAQGRTVIRARLSQWLDPTANNPVYPFKGDKALNYDTTWGGISPMDGINNPGHYWKVGGSQSEFGSGGYNDHLFHYGYFFYSVATVLYSNRSVDIEWFRKVENRVLALAREVANPSQIDDPWFTQFRHKSDWYSGHSWASGLFPSGNYPNVESTSEATNAWYSLYLLGHSLAKTGRTTLGINMMNVGKFFAITDVQSFNHYVHLYGDWTKPDLPPMRNKIYPNEFTQLGVVGNLWSGQAVYQTFWAWGDCECIESPLLVPGCAIRHLLTKEQVRYYNTLFTLMIQFMPFTPFTNAHADREWIKQMFFTRKLAFNMPDGSVSYGYSPAGKAHLLPDIYTTCQQQISTLACDGWLVYAWQVHSMMGRSYRDEAWNEVVRYGAAALGNTLTNALFYIASQPN